MGKLRQPVLGTPGFRNGGAKESRFGGEHRAGQVAQGLKRGEAAGSASQRGHRNTSLVWVDIGLVTKDEQRKKTRENAINASVG